MAHKGSGRSGPYGSYKTETRDQILEAAITEFARAGYCGTTTKEIAKLSDIEERTLFNHFKSKDALFDAAVKYAIGAVQPRAAELEDIIVRSPSDKGFRLAVLRFCEIMDGDFVRLYAFTVLERRGPLALSFGSCIDAFGREFERLLPRPTVQILIDYCLQARIFRHASGRAKHRAAVDSFVQILLTGVGKPVVKAHRTR